MALLDRLLGPRREQLGTYSSSRYRLSEIPGTLLGSGQTSAAGVDVNQESAMSLSAVFAAVNTLSSIVATLPLNVYQKNSGRREVAEANPAHFILHNQYNREMTAAVGRRTSEFHRLLWGNSFTERETKNSGQLIGLWPTQPWRVKRDRDEIGELIYIIDGKRRVAARDMIDETLVSEDGIEGKSFIDYACGSLGLSIAAQQFSETFFGSGAKPGGLLAHPGNPDPKQRSEMKAGWERTHGGPDNAHKVGVIWGGWEWKDANQTMSPMDAQLLEVRAFTVTEVARWLNVPPHILRDLSKSSFSNIEQQSIEFVTYSLGPTLVFKEQEYDRKLLNPPDVYCKHNLTGLLRGDSVARAEYASKMFMAGFYTINQVLELEEKNPIGPDGDVHFVPVNLQPLDRAINSPHLQATILQAPTDADEEDDLPVEPPAEMQAALCSLLSSTFDRMLRKESNEGKRAAKSPGKFFVWLDTFYSEFQSTLSSALTEPIRVLNAMSGTDLKPSALAADYCRRSRETLLEMAGNAKQSEFAEACDREFTAWESNRANDEATRVLHLFSKE